MSSGGHRERMGQVAWRQRFYHQVHHASDVFSHGRNLFHFENAEKLHILVYAVLRATGLYGVANRNFLDLRVEEREWSFDNLPVRFDGFRLLQLTDLHIDLDTALTPRIKTLVESLDYDLCVITGDFRASTHGCYDTVIAEMEKLRPAIRGECYAVLGNHDFVEMLEPLESLGIRFLLNENVTLERGGEVLRLCGIDDSSFYATENFERALAGVQDEDFKILLAHSPDVYRQAAALGFDLQLSGHTHGGQICLPGGVPVVTVCRCPRKMVAGRWSYQSLQGYTSRGTGSCGVAARFFCPPEVTLHRLRRPS